MAQCRMKVKYRGMIPDVGGANWQMAKGQGNLLFFYFLLSTSAEGPWRAIRELPLRVIMPL